MIRTAMTAWVLAITLGSAGAQTPDAGLTFEVASVRPAAPLPRDFASIGIHGGPGTADPGQIAYGLVNMKILLTRAYGVKSLQILGPSWLDTEMYDITAKVPPGTTSEQLNVMLQNLLVERFGLAAHHEAKETQVYALVAGNGGSKLMESVEDPNQPPQPSEAVTRITMDKNGVPQLPPGRADLATFGGLNGRFYLIARQQPISAAIPEIERGWGHVIVDQTGLTGRYDFIMELPRPGGASAASANPSDGASEPAMGLAAIVQRDLGLRLKEIKAPVNMLVIDHINKIPTEN